MSKVGLQRVEWHLILSLLSEPDQHVVRKLIPQEETVYEQPLIYSSQWRPHITNGSGLAC